MYNNIMAIVIENSEEHLTGESPSEGMKMEVLDDNQSDYVEIAVLGDTPDEMKSVKFDDLKIETRINMSQFDVYTVSCDCELRDCYVNKKGKDEEEKLKFRRGCPFYDFKHEFERISRDQQVILLDKVSSSYI